ncbi:MAG: GNAT family N-acetyltransferase [Candidatus Amulumruptor caecigallinarius]|nr:GNAT family N-acetyltransferase [Candidatus Amulumruptor caecigallinarius]MCM1396097.1 GNAT family N-acetyltransferase [Candidatus Amulumruptor caecigallinarius]MCM1453894.1 GNAT family N-acetyltransferase [bacterium]
MNNDQVSVIFATEEHIKYAEHIVNLIYESALQRGTGIARRSPKYIEDKIRGGKAVVAMYGDRLIGFSYIESWGHGDYVATSGLIVDPEFRKLGLAGRIKNKTFELARRRFPYAKIFSITTSLPVMKLNSRLGYEPVTFSELPQEDEFWNGCQGCVNYDILMRNNRTRCLCYGMLYDPKAELKKQSWFTPYRTWIATGVRKLFHLKK